MSSAAHSSLERITLCQSGRVSSYRITNPVGFSSLNGILAAFLCCPGMHGAHAFLTSAAAQIQLLWRCSLCRPPFPPFRTMHCPVYAMHLAAGRRCFEPGSSASAWRQWLVRHTSAEHTCAAALQRDAGRQQRRGRWPERHTRWHPRQRLRRAGVGWRPAQQLAR